MPICMNSGPRDTGNNALGGSGKGIPGGMFKPSGRFVERLSRPWRRGLGGSSESNIGHASSGCEDSTVGSLRSR